MTIKMISKKNKKGVSAIVATSLIILITVAAISIVWAIVLPMIKGNLYNSQVCSNIVGAITIRTNTGETCWNKTNMNPDDTTGTVFVQIERSSANIILTSLNLRAIDSNGNAKNKIIKTNNETIFGVNGLSPGDVYVYNQSTEQKVVAFEIIPVITVGTHEYSCNEAIASAEVDAC